MLVLDDLTPLIRAQKVAAWREVARRLAHEIKNPLTPIQLSAERMRRKLTDARPAARSDLVQECTATIIGEVESLKGLVDEFSQFARMPAPRAVPTDLHELHRRDAGPLRRAVHRRAVRAPLRPTRRAGARRPRADEARLINLVDNAIEAMDAQGTIVIETAPRSAQQPRAHRRRRRRARHSGREREKLFVPYYSTKGRGSGLGLAIVRRIVAEHGGAIDVADNVPRGTRFTIELPRADVTSLAGACRAAPVSSSCLSILVVDDEPGVRSSLAGVLRDEGFDVEAVGPARSASTASRSAATTSSSSTSGCRAWTG